MKHIKTFESVLTGDSFTKELEIIKNWNRPISIDDLNNIFKSLNITFSLIDDLEKNHGFIYTSTEEDSGFMGGFITLSIFSEFNKRNNTIFLILHREWEKTFNRSRISFIKSLKRILEHELVHREQYSKRGSKLISTFKRAKSQIEYYSKPEEIMAYAKNTAEYLKDIFGDKSFEIIRSGATLRELKIYCQLDSKTYNRFRKYVFFYLKSIN